MIITTIGAAVVALSVAGASLGADGSVGMVTRNQEPTRLDVVDLASQELAASQALPAGDGAWGVTAASDGFWVGTFGAAEEDQDNLVRVDGSGIADRFSLPSNFIWDLDTGPQDQVVGVQGTIGGSFELPSPDRPLNPVPLITGDELGRAVTVVGARTVAGGSAGDRAVLYVQEGQDRRSVLPPELAGDQQIYSAAARNDSQVVAGTVGPARQDAAVAVVPLDDPSAAVVVRVPGESVIDRVMVDRGQVWATARPSGALYRIPPGATSATQVAIPRLGAETRELAVRDDQILGVAADGAVWEVDPRNGEVALTEAADLGVQPGPELAQSLAAADGVVWAGGSFAVQSRVLASDEVHTAFVPGEPKDIAVVDGSAYLAMYPIAAVWAVDGPGAEPRPVADLPSDQIRPQSIVGLPDGRLAVTTTDDFGGGALSVVDPADGEATTVVDPLGAGQIPTSLLVHDDLLLVGANGEPAALAAVDPDTLDVVWQIEDAAPGGGFLNGLTATEDGLVVTVSNRGEIVVVDPAVPPEVLRRGEVEGDGVAGRARTGALGPVVATYDEVLAIDPDTATATPLVTGLGAEVFGFPHLAVDADGVTYAIEGRDVISLVPDTGDPADPERPDTERPDTGTPEDRGRGGTVQDGRPSHGGPIEEEGLSQPPQAG